MDSRKRISIREPIWKDRSVGLNISDCNPDTEVEISIDYRNKDGKLLWPKPFLVLARDIFAYPTKKTRGVTLNIVPIDDLQRKLSIIEKQEIMLFDKKSITATIKDSQEQRGNGKKSLPPGKHLMVATQFEEKQSKDGNPMVVVHMTDANDEYKTILNHYKLDGPNTEIIRDMFVKFLYRSFEYELKPAADMAALMKQLKKLEGKKFGAAIRGKQKLISENGSMKEIQISEFWYSCKEDELEDMTVDVSKLIVPVGDADKAQLAQAQKLQNMQQQSTPVVAPVEEEEEELGNNGEEIAPEPAEPPKQVEASFDQEEQTEQDPAQEAGGDDDFPW
jgi:hypothetical protein